MNERQLGAMLVAFLLLTTLCVQAIFVWRPMNKHTVHVWVLDVGQGDAILVDAPSGQVLIDGGPSAEVLDKLGGAMPFWDRTIEYVVNTHPHADHYAGLVSVLERYQVGEVWVTGEVSRGDGFHAFVDVAGDAVRLAAYGEEIDLGDGAFLRVIWPQVSIEGETLEDPNDGSIVFLLEDGDVRMLFTGDVGIEQEGLFLDDVPDIDVLKVGHHGSSTSTSITLLERASPEVAVISVGENSYGHPHTPVLKRLEQLGIAVFRTDIDGDIRIKTNGKRVRVHRFSL